MSTNPSSSELVIPAIDIVMATLPVSETTLSNRAHIDSVQETSIYSSQNVAWHGIHMAEIWLKVQLMIASHTVRLDFFFAISTMIGFKLNFHEFRK